MAHSLRVLQPVASPKVFGSLPVTELPAKEYKHLMKDLDDGDVARISGLAMLRLNAAELATMRTELNSILHAFAALDRLEAPGALEHDRRSGLVLAEVLRSGDETTRARQDVAVAPCCDHTALIGVFPQSEGDLLVVPLVIEREDA